MDDFTQGYLVGSIVAIVILAIVAILSVRRLR